MANYYKWTIAGLDCIPTLGDKTNYVVACHWRYGVSNMEDLSAEGCVYTDIFGVENFPQDETSTDFTPFEQLTEAQVIGWLEAAFEKPESGKTIAGMQENLDERLENLINPPIVRPSLPWNQVIEEAPVAEEAPVDQAGV